MQKFSVICQHQPVYRNSGTEQVSLTGETVTGGKAVGIWVE